MPDHLNVFVGWGTGAPTSRYRYVTPFLPTLFSVLLRKPVRAKRPVCNFNKIFSLWSFLDANYLCLITCVWSPVSDHLCDFHFRCVHSTFTRGSLPLQPLQKHTSSAFLWICICQFGDRNFSFTATKPRTFNLLPPWRVLLKRFLSPQFFFVCSCGWVKKSGCLCSTWLLRHVYVNRLVWTR